MAKGSSCAKCRKPDLCKDATAISIPDGVQPPTYLLCYAPRMIPVHPYKIDVPLNPPAILTIPRVGFDVPWNFRLAGSGSHVGHSGRSGHFVAALALNASLYALPSSPAPLAPCLRIDDLRLSPLEGLCSPSATPYFLVYSLAEQLTPEEVTALAKAGALSLGAAANYLATVPVT